MTTIAYCDGHVIADTMAVSGDDELCNTRYEKLTELTDKNGERFILGIAGEFSIEIPMLPWHEDFSVKDLKLPTKGVWRKAFKHCAIMIAYSEGCKVSTGTNLLFYSKKNLVTMGSGSPYFVGSFSTATELGYTKVKAMKTAMAAAANCNAFTGLPLTIKKV